jgi:putative flavoprotein involved in K+ transport
VHLSIGARQTPLPQRILGRDLFRYLEATGLMGKTVESRIGQRMQHRETLIGSSPRAARRRHGIELRGRADQVSGSEVRFNDGGRLSPGTVIWATGYERDHSFVHAPVFEADGRLVHQRGVTASPGLYFLGMPWQYTRGSALLGWIKDDAQHIADQVATLASTGTGPELVAPHHGG